MSGPCGCSEWNMGYPWAPYYYYYYPYSCWQGYWAQPAPDHRVILPQELLAHSEKKQLFVGGEEPVRLTLEYMPDAADKGMVTVVVDEAGKKSEWSPTDMSEGYHVKRDFDNVEPGATILLVAENVVARLRWCEIVEY